MTMTNTIPNVPRELLEDCLIAARGPINGNLAERLSALLSAPSPAGVDGLEVVAWWLKSSKKGEDLIGFGSSEHIYAGVYDEKIPLCDVPKAQAIIDGLRGENEALHAQVKVLQSNANSWQSGYDEGRRMGGKHCALTIDQHAQRIGELEGLLRSCLPALSDGGCAALANRIDAALASGHEVPPCPH